MMNDECGMMNKLMEQFIIQKQSWNISNVMQNHE